MDRVTAVGTGSSNYAGTNYYGNCSLSPTAAVIASRDCWLPGLYVSPDIVALPAARMAMDEL